ncbi:1,2-phenylacetyl-CoA epoxidase subunit PaaE [Actinomycetospora sp. TBRC 11914]|uniref:1,2-phenylacetyl-CoA epoxidase subunit PaaE n=1 Tax=Actinomycetospora sp. TBRC 11914 TaxID=2729387 RepID=UPI00145EA592|nr:1,2-phenylacetyl-CoA epoxidase subunit PaaE [Actinomycetospora sp. TBRC 11914]NMO90232.1 phenylacetate-CoA oxygenase/reductase subunit PaaK [Actinomycetospora sp. TBRC 11914]
MSAPTTEPSTGADDAPAGFHRLRVADVDRLTDDAVAVTFDVPGELAETFAFRAGQYLTLRLPTPDGEERRSYSICAPEGAAPRIGVRRVETGLFSEWLVDRLTAGDELEVGPPEGRFTPDPRPGEHHTLVAAGSGITPVLSIAATVLAAHPDTHVTLLYGNRRTDTVMFAEELADLKDRYPARLQLGHVLSREPVEAEIFAGRLDREKLHTLLTSLVPTPQVDHWWLCGPLEMVTGARDLLAELGIGRERVHAELFYVDTPPPRPVRHEDVDADAEGAEATIVLHGRSVTATLPRDRFVLDAAQKVRSDLPFACKGGVCGTCRAKVVSGRVDLQRNFALEPEEIEAGFVLTCQSVPVSDELVIDYDV